MAKLSSVSFYVLTGANLSLGFEFFLFFFVFVFHFLFQNRFCGGLYESTNSNLFCFLRFDRLELKFVVVVIISLLFEARPSSSRRARETFRPPSAETISIMGEVCAVLGTVKKVMRTCVGRKAERTVWRDIWVYPIHIKI